MKVWAYLIILFLIIGAVSAAAKSFYSAGYNKRDQEVQQDIINAQQLAAVEAEARWSASVVAATQAIRIEERIVEQIREVEVLVPTIVDRIVEVVPECADLGLAYAGLLNNQIRAGNGVQAPPITSSPDG